MTVNYGDYKGLHSIILENGRLKVTVLPSLGSKMASLQNKTTGKEYLWQASSEKCPLPEYDTPFDNWDMFGFDEMFPTIDACFYEKKPWWGVRLPDHGEVWPLPWEFEVEQDKVHLWVYGIRLPYRLDKWVSFSGPGIVHLEYRVTNLAPFEMKFIWAAHPLFQITPGMRILLPSEVNHVVNVLKDPQRLGEYHGIHDWPKTVLTNRSEYRLDRIGPNTCNQFGKYYAVEKLCHGWAAFYQPESKEIMALSFPVDRVPYLGIWVNEGGFANQYNAALEPCTGAMDRVDTAAQHGKVAILKAKGEYAWYLNLTIHELSDLNDWERIYFSDDGEIHYGL